MTEELRSISDIFNSNQQLKKILFHPGIGKTDKKDMLKALFGDKITKLTLRLLLLLVEKKRETIFNDICGAFFQKVDDLSGLKKITIETAYQLEEKEKENLIAKLEKAMDKKLVVDTKVNPAILGGIIIKERMKQMDASVIQFLRSMKNDLSAMRISDEIITESQKPAKAKKTVKKAVKKTTIKKTISKIKKPVKKIKKKSKK